MDVIEAVDLRLRRQAQQRQRHEGCDPFFHQLSFLFVLARETLMKRSAKKRSAKTTPARFIFAMKIFRPRPPGRARVEDGQEDVRTPGL
jgi:hypothetical protein